MADVFVVYGNLGHDPVEPNMSAFDTQGQAHAKFMQAAEMIAGVHDDLDTWKQAKARVQQIKLTPQQGHIWRYPCGCFVALTRAALINAQ